MMKTIAVEEFAHNSHLNRDKNRNKLIINEIQIKSY